MTRALFGSICRPAAGPIVRAALAVCVLAGFGSTALATDFTVTKTADTNDGVCNADCSLREAIAAANLNVGADRVILTGGQTYSLSLNRLTVTDALTLEGSTATINGGGLDRVLDILGAFSVTINGGTITGGVASGFLSLGGGINIRGASVVLNGTIVTNNSTALESGARDDGGGIAVVGSFNAAAGTTALASLTLNNASVSNNTGANGGGIVCVLCTLTVSTSAITGNQAIAGDGGGGAILGNASTAAITSSALVNNTVTGGAVRGGGLSVPFGASATTLSRNRIVLNTGTLGSAIFNNLGTITASNNWWGCNFGPGTSGVGCPVTPNGVSGTVTTTPFLILKGAASPTSIVPGGSSTITADLTFNSSSGDTSAGGTVPNGMTAAFSGTLGTFATSTAPTVLGKAADVFTSSGVLGTANLSLAVDGQTISQSLTIAGCQTITLSSTTFPNGTAGVAYPPTTVTQIGGIGLTTFLVTSGALPDGLALSSGGTVSGTPTQPGGFNFVATATDANGCMGSRAYPLTVDPGSVLTISTIANTTTRRAAPVTVSFIVSNLGAGTLVATSSNLTLVPNANLAIGGSGANRTLTAAAVSGQIGVTTITVTATSGGQTASTSFTLLVYSGSPADFDGDGKSDVTVFRPSTGIWYVRNSSGGTAFLQWGISGDIPVPGDYDGDGISDIALFRPSTGIWYIRNSSNGSSSFIQWGINGDLPAPGDYDGDGRADTAVFRPSTGIWYIRYISTGATAFLQWGMNGDLSVAGDYDGDLKTDSAVFRPSTATWFIRLAATGDAAFFQWGITGDIPLSGDFNGDGRTDLAVFRPSTGIWYVWSPSTGTMSFYQWGVNGDIPVAGDFDGDGKTDIVVFRPSTGIWYILNSSNNSSAFQQWGLNGDIPVLKKP